VNCDCGYNFLTKAITRSAAPKTAAARINSSAFVRRVAFDLLYGGLLGLPWGAILANSTGDRRWTQRLPLLIVISLIRRPNREEALPSS
jgi:hypothetical protein